MYVQRNARIARQIPCASRSTEIDLNQGSNKRTCINKSMGEKFNLPRHSTTQYRIVSHIMKAHWYHRTNDSAQKKFPELKREDEISLLVKNLNQIYLNKTLRNDTVRPSTCRVITPASQRIMSTFHKIKYTRI